MQIVVVAALGLDDLLEDRADLVPHRVELLARVVVELAVHVVDQRVDVERPAAAADLVDGRGEGAEEGQVVDVEVRRLRGLRTTLKGPLRAAAGRAGPTQKRCASWARARSAPLLAPRATTSTRGVTPGLPLVSAAFLLEFYNR